MALALILGVAVAGSGRALSALPPAGAVETATEYGSTLTVRKPATTVSGDVLVASVDVRLSGAASITPPNGWVLIRRDSNTPAYLALTQALYYKVAGSGEPATYTWSLASSAAAVGSVIDFKDVDATSPIDSHSGASTSQSGSIVAPSVTTTAAGAIVVGFFGDTLSKAIRPPSEMTEEFDAGWAQRWNLDAEGSAYIEAVAGATGNMTARTSGHPSSAIGQLLALRSHVTDTNGSCDIHGNLGFGNPLGDIEGGFPAGCVGQNPHADPLFANRGGLNFHTLQGRPAIDAGDRSFSPAVDFDLVSRPQGAGPDIGSYER